MTDKLFDVPNDFILALFGLLSTIWAVSTTFAQYLRVPQFGRFDHDNAEKVLSRNTLLIMRKASAFLMLLSFILVPRSRTPLYQEEFWHLRSLNKGGWCIIRLAIEIGVGGSVFLFDSDVIFRYIASLGYPTLTVINLLSEINLVREINCIQSEMCSTSQFGGWSVKQLQFYAIRDIISYSVSLFIIVLTLWIFPVFGMFRNRFWIPRKEHRDFSSLTAVQIG